MKKKIGLGTALWGWSVSEAEAYAMLDYFYAEGGRVVDSAYNYPLNNNASDARKSLKFLSSWCHHRQVADLEVMYKVGSLSNLRSSAIELTQKNIQNQVDEAFSLLGQNLRTIMIHWDNESSPEEIFKTSQILKTVCHDQFQLGLSGIKSPEFYTIAFEKLNIAHFAVQVKSNILESGLNHYLVLDSLQPQYWAYGIGLSGVKIDQNQYQRDSYVSLARGETYHREIMSDKLIQALMQTQKLNPELASLYKICIAYAIAEPKLFGFLLGASKLEQLQQSLDFIKNSESKIFDLTALDQR